MGPVQEPTRERALAEVNSFDGRVAVVTGGAGGMGRAAVDRLVEAGAKVVVVDIDLAAAQAVVKSHPGGVAVAVSADVATKQGTDAYVEAAVSAFGRVDVFFSNAGVLGTAEPLMDASPEAWAHVSGINTLGTVLGLQAVARQMTAQGGGGSIVVTASIAGMRSAPGVGLYGATKAAVLSLVRTAAREWGPEGIRVNAICPGPTYTNFSAMSAESVEQLTARVPLGRLAVADDMARAALWLLGDGASFVTGVMVPVDGGQEA